MDFENNSLHETPIQGLSDAKTETKLRMPQVAPFEEGLELLKKRGMKKVRVGELRGDPANIYYKTVGSGSEKVILVMGLLARAETWDHQVKRLSKDHEVLILDNRGCGESCITKNRFTTSMMAHDAYEVMCHLNWDKYHITGASMGGMIAQELALIAPEKVASLTLIATHCGSPYKSIPPMKCLYVMLKNFFVSDLTEREHNSLGILYGPDVHEDKELYDEVHTEHVNTMATYGAAPLKAFINQISAILTHRVTKDRFQALRDHDVHVVVATGDCDSMVHPSNSHDIASMLDVEPIVLNRVGHHIVRERPDLLADLIDDSIKQSIKKRQGQCAS